MLGLVPPIIWGFALIGLRYGLYYNTLRGYKRRINSLSSEIEAFKADFLEKLVGFNQPDVSGPLKELINQPATYLAFNRQVEAALKQVFFKDLNKASESELKDYSRVASSLRMQVMDYNRLALGKYDRRTARLLGFKPIAVPA